MFIDYQRSFNDEVHVSWNNLLRQYVSYTVEQSGGHMLSENFQRKKRCPLEFTHREKR